jgi:hypothetical protein
MGYNIGIRLIEDFLAKSSAPTCTNFREVAEMISKVEWPADNHSSGGQSSPVCRSASRSS